MKGKIFSSSDNIYQDQAKILFDYYRQSAEKIVKEEERIEGEIAKLKEQKASLEVDLSKAWYWLLTIILFFVYFIKKNNLTKQIAEVDTRIAEFEKLHKEIFRDYKVSKLGVAYVPVADQVKYNDKSFIVDYTSTVPNSEVTLQVSRQNDLLIDAIGKLEQQATEAPIVESSQDPEPIATDDYSTSIQEINQHDYIGGLERSMRTISYCMNDLDVTSVMLPLVANNSSQHHFLNEFATKEVDDDATIINVFDKERYSDSIEKFQELNKLKDSLSNKTQQFEDVLKGLMTTMAQSVQSISALKLASVDKVVLESNRILLNILKAPYNHYSPMLEFEEIERIKNETFDYGEDVQNYEPFRLKQSSRVKYNMLTGMWTSEDGNVTNMPFGVHQIHEEIVAPVVQNLMNETRIERLKIYNHIKDQKLSYLNKWHQDTEAFYRANRAESADIINIMQESLREYVAAYNTLVSLKKTEASMNNSDVNLDNTIVEVSDNADETLLAFELQSQEFQKIQNEFEEYMERLKEDINMKAERFGHIEYYDARLRDGYSNEVAVAASEIAELDNRRKSLATVNPLLAKSSTLLPEPNIEDITFEHIALNLPAMAKQTLSDLDQMDLAIEEARMEETVKTADADADAEALEEVDANAAPIDEEVALEEEANELSDDEENEDLEEECDSEEESEDSEEENEDSESDEEVEDSDEDEDDEEEESEESDDEESDDEENSEDESEDDDDESEDYEDDEDSEDDDDDDEDDENSIEDSVKSLVGGLMKGINKFK
ncbi:MAG: hypothetical protein IKW47_02505 [Alistipes sp.]|nr:hypothetical protein [Alistipes sp.]